MSIRDLVIGGVAGAAVAALGAHYFSGAGTSPSAAAAGAAGGLSAAAAAPQAMQAPPAAVGASAAVLAGQGLVPAAAAAGVACPPAVAAADSRKAASPAAPAALATVRVDVPAVTLSSEHAQMLLDMDKRPPSLPELHARFAGEPLDSAWSQQMEAQLRQALQDAGVQKGFELLAVECRRTLCELRLFGTGPDVDRRWGAISGQLSQQPWWGQNFSGASSSTTGINDRSVIATILHRSKR